MAATVGELVVNLTARTAAFDRHLRGSSRHVTTFGSRATEASRGLVRLATGMAAAVGVGVIARQFKQTADQLDRLGKVSRKLGTTVEQLAGLRHAAHLAGIATNTLDMALQRMTRRVSEAAVGTGEAQAAIRELGLSAKVLAAAGPYESLLKIAEAMRQVENPADRLRLAFKLFDSEGAELVNMMSEGGGLIESSKELAEVLARLGVNSTRAAKDIAKVKDEAYTTWKIFKGMVIDAPLAGLAAATRLNDPVYLANLGKNRAAEIQAAANQQAEVWKEKEEGYRRLLQRMGKIAPDPLESTESIRNRGRWQMEQDYGKKMMADLAEQEQRAAAAESQRRQDAKSALRKAGQELAARMAHIRSVIGQQIRGGDGGGLQLPGAYGAGSAQAYSATVRAGMQQTGKKTDQEILDATLKLLKEEEDTKRVIEGIAEKIDDLEVGVTNLR